MFKWTLSTRVRRAALVAASAAAVSLFSTGASTQAPRFYPDDPIAREPESRDASNAAPYEQSQMYELLFNLFINSKHEPSGLRAKNINTIDEVADSSWFTNRIGSRPMTTEEITRGPIIGAPPDPSKWVLIREKTAGAHPGFTATDAQGQTWFLEFDPPWAPGAATGAVVIATKIFWALGYNQVESFLTTFDPKTVTIDPKATVRRPNGKRTRFTHDDVNVILENVRRNPDGTYRVIAGRLLPGKILYGFQDLGPVLTTPTISCRTSTGASCGRCACSARGRTSPTSRTPTRSTQSSPKTAEASSSTTCRTSAPPSACATPTTSGI